MPVFRSFPRFLASAYAAPKAMLSRLKWTLDRHSDFLENIEGEDGVEIRKNYKGGITISATGASSEITASGYASYFKVYDASGGGACKIGVKDGSAVDPLVGQCGFVWANGEVVGVEAYESVAIEAAGSIWVWRVDEVGAEGFDTYVETTTSSTPPTGGGFAYRTRLLGRAEIVSDGAGGHVVSDINQDYLKGGDDEVYLWWDCDIPEQEPEA